MIVTGFMGSPRKGGNTAFLLKTFLENAERHGAETHSVHVPALQIHPCTGCALCERKGFCHFEDDMQKVVLPLMRMSDVIVIAAPVYFYNFPAELKALIDRSQTLWSRRYKLRLTDVGKSYRKGFLLSVGATRGKDLFDGLHLTMKYFFRGISTEFSGELTYSRIEGIGDMKRHETVLADVDKTVETLLQPLKQRRPTLLFVCSDNSLVSQLAAAFVQHYAGERIEALSAGTQPASNVHPELARTMERIGLDADYRTPRSVSSVIESVVKPDQVILMGRKDDTAIHVPGARLSTWDMPLPQELTPEAVDQLRDRINAHVKTLIEDIHETHP